jgi:hypothetical protein
MRGQLDIIDLQLNNSNSMQLENCCMVNYGVEQLCYYYLVL